jgi:hypothetical protein
MHEEDSSPKHNNLPDNLIPLTNHIHSKAIQRLLKRINPRMKSSDLNEHFHHLVHSLISQDELFGLDFQIKMKQLCVEVENCIAASRTAIFYYDSETYTVKSGAAPSMPDIFYSLIADYNESSHKLESTFEFDIKVDHFFQDRRWTPFYRYFISLNVASSWTIPIHRDHHFICILVIFFDTSKEPKAKELAAIYEHRNQLSKLMLHYSEQLPSLRYSAVQALNLVPPPPSSQDS